jgi:hypothetical protein
MSTIPFGTGALGTSGGSAPITSSVTPYCNDGAIIFAHTLFSDHATITTTAPLANNPSQLQTRQPSDLFVTGDLAANEFSIVVNMNDVSLNLGADANSKFQVVSLLYVHHTDLLTWAVDVSADGSDWSVYNSGDMDINLSERNFGLSSDLFTKKDFIHLSHILDASYSGYVRFTLKTASTKSLSIGKVLCSELFKPSHNIDYKWSLGYVDTSVVNRSHSQASYADKRAQVRTQDFALGFMSEDDMYNSIYQFDRVFGINTPFLVIPKPPNLRTPSPAHTLYATMTELNPIVNDFINLYSRKFKFMEVL